MRVLSAAIREVTSLTSVTWVRICSSESEAVCRISPSRWCIASMSRCAAWRTRVREAGAVGSVARSEKDWNSPSSAEASPVSVGSFSAPTTRSRTPARVEERPSSDDSRRNPASRKASRMRSTPWIETPRPTAPSGICTGVAATSRTRWRL